MACLVKNYHFKVPSKYHFLVFSAKIRSIQLSLRNCQNVYGVWWMSGGCLKGDWKVPGGCLKVVWKVSMGCSNGNLVCQNRSGLVRTGQDWSGLVRTGQNRPGLVRTSQDWYGLARTGHE